MGEQGGRVVYTQPGGIPTICCMSSRNWLHLASAGWQTLLPWPSTVLHLPAPHHPVYWLQETLFLGGGADAAPPFTMVGRVNAIPPCSLMDGVDMGPPWLSVFGAIALLPGMVLTAKKTGGCTCVHFSVMACSALGEEGWRGGGAQFLNLQFPRHILHVTSHFSLFPHYSMYASHCTCSPQLTTQPLL